MNSLVVLILNFIFLALILALAFVLIIKYTKLALNHKRLSKYLYNYLNIIISARYGNLNTKCEDGIDALSIQLSKNTNALLESITDRDMMIAEHIEKEKQTQNLKKDFIQSLAHDLKVPIIAQDNTFDLFLNGNFGEISNVQKDVIKNLKISNNDLKNLVIDLLDAQKLENSEFEPNFEIVNLNSLILESIEQNKSILEVKNKKIEFLSNATININLDPYLIKRVLNNLISNAIFYGKNSKNIKIILSEVKNYAKISVLDNGEGINEQDLTNIFAKYYTSSKKYSNIANGLGLYIVNKIIAAHKGKIEAKNNPEGGANFSVFLPLKNV